MRNLIVHTWMTLDGVAEAPGAPEEDTSGGFRHGGWYLRHFDDTSQACVVERYAAAGSFLFGRRPFQSLAAYAREMALYGKGDYERSWSR
jgi:hypothetical protein